jgi:hypothetical protein
MVHTSNAKTFPKEFCWPLNQKRGSNSAGRGKYRAAPHHGHRALVFGSLATLHPKTPNSPRITNLFLTVRKKKKKKFLTF